MKDIVGSLYPSNGQDDIKGTVRSAWTGGPLWPGSRLRGAWTGASNLEIVGRVSPGGGPPRQIRRLTSLPPGARVIRQDPPQRIGDDQQCVFTCFEWNGVEDCGFLCFDLPGNGDPGGVARRM